MKLHIKDIDKPKSSIKNILSIGKYNSIIRELRLNKFKSFSHEKFQLIREMRLAVMMEDWQIVWYSITNADIMETMPPRGSEI